MHKIRTTLKKVIITRMKMNSCYRLSIWLCLLFVFGVWGKIWWCCIPTWANYHWNEIICSFSNFDQHTFREEEKFFATTLKKHTRWTGAASRSLIYYQSLPVSQSLSKKICLTTKCMITVIVKKSSACKIVTSPCIALSNYL